VTDEQAKTKADANTALRELADLKRAEARKPLPPPPPLPTPSSGSGGKSAALGNSEKQRLPQTAQPPEPRPEGVMVGSSAQQQWEGFWISLTKPDVKRFAAQFKDADFSDQKAMRYPYSVALGK
jgi:hypothetical protein